MAYSGGVTRKVLKKYQLAQGKMGSEARVLECHHAIVIQRSDKSTRHVCRICTKTAEAEAKASEPTKKALKQLISKVGIDEVLDALIQRELAGNRMRKIQKLRWERRHAQLAQQVANGVDRSEPEPEAHPE